MSLILWFIRSAVNKRRCNYITRVLLAGCSFAVFIAGEVRAQAPERFKPKDKATMEKEWLQKLIQPHDDVTPPRLTFFEPIVRNDSIRIVHNSEILKIKGCAEDESGIRTIFINGDSVFVSTAGDFSRKARSGDFLQKARLNKLKFRTSIKIHKKLYN